MIANILKENCKLTFSNLPQLDLCGYEVCVRSVYAEFKDDVSNQYITISSTMVDKGPLNPKQEIISFNNSSYFNNKIDYKPTLLTWYPIQVSMIEDCKIEFSIGDKKLQQMKKLHLQLEFREICY